MIQFSVEAVRYGRQDITLELVEVLETPQAMVHPRCAAQNGCSINLRFKRDDPAFADIVEKATTGATFTLTLDEKSPA